MQKTIVKIDGVDRNDIVHVGLLQTTSVTVPSVKSSLGSPEWEVIFESGERKVYPFYRVEVRVYE